MPEFKEQFVVKSKSKKTKEKEDETQNQYSVFLMSEESNMRINLHSGSPINLKLGDELELRSIKYQKNIKEEK